jgi:hypothetical protein
MQTLLAEMFMDLFSNLPLFLSVAAGVVAGLGTVGAIHYLIRPRRTAAPVPDSFDRPPDNLPPDPFVHGSASENRSSFRRQGNPVEVKIVNKDMEGAQVGGWVVDRSIGGLGLLVETPFDVDTTWAVRPTNAPPVAPWVQVVIKSCRQSKHGWEVGCQFTKTPPWAVMLLFG